MQIDGEMSRALADSDKADFLEIMGFHVSRSDFFRGFFLLSLPSVLQNICGQHSSQEAATDRQTSHSAEKCDFLHHF